MKGKLKKIFNNKIFIFIFGGVLFSAVSVYAVTYFPSNQVTYDNSSSKLSSTNVQGAIDELYNTCSKVASSGKYLYFGANKRYDNSGGIMASYVYRCNLDGNSCLDIFSSSNLEIAGIYATSENLYFVAHEYYTSGRILGGYIYRCNLDGSSCSIIFSNSNFKITDIYATSKNLYFGANEYYTSGGILGGFVYKCNLDGNSCSIMFSNSNLEIAGV